MRSLGAAFGSGLLFALGLGVSGMTKPSKVVDFLDVSGRWDASLALVMVGAIVVYFALHRTITRRAAPLFASRFDLPTRRDVDLRLLLGAGLFGVGWGIGGYCPGPGLVAVVSGVPSAVVFVASMATGMWIAQRQSGSLWSGGPEHERSRTARAGASTIVTE